MASLKMYMSSQLYNVFNIKKTKNKGTVVSYKNIPKI